MSESLPPEAGSLHGEIPDKPENREFFKELLKEDTHDPLCPLVATTCGVPPADHDDLCPLSVCGGCPCCGPDGCYCALIARVRANEREKIEKKVYAKCYHTKYVGVEPCSHDIIVRYLLGGDD